MLLFVLRKMAANRWMVISLLVGMILAVAMVTTIPIYSRGILSRMLLRDLQIYQENTGRFPGFIEISGYLPADPEARERLAIFHEYAAAIGREVERGVPAPLLSESYRLRHNGLKARRVDQPEGDLLQARLGMASGFFEHVTPIAGTLPGQSEVSRPAGEPAVIEGIITEATAAEGKFLLGGEYEILDARDEQPIGFIVRIVGIVGMSDPTDIFWSTPIRINSGAILVAYDELSSTIDADPSAPMVQVSWTYVFQYEQLTSEEAAPMARFIREQTQAGRQTGLTVQMPTLRILEAYAEREKTLKLTMWVLQVPLLLMLVFYLFMVSQVLIDHERNEIALLKSRGAAGVQIFLTYVMFGAILSLIAVIVGPTVGMAICQILGASSGFLEFVQRRRLHLVYTAQTYLYAIAAAGLGLFTMLLPALRASRTTIVLHKQRFSQRVRKPLWKVVFADILALGISLYGLYRYHSRSQVIQLSGINPTDLPVDPMLFFVSTLFVIGIGLLFLRFYPALVRLVFRLGRRRWSPAAFSSLVQVGRGGGKDQFLMLFIILSISVGVFNADTARTLNQNAEEQIRYKIGADVVVQERWNQVDESGSIISDISGPYGPVQAEQKPGRYVEPGIRRFSELPGVARITPVFRQDRASGRVLGGDSFANVTIMGIVPAEFGEIAWFRNGLLGSHWYNYLNLMAESPAAALLSSSLKEKGVELGDPIYLQWTGQQSALYYVYAFVDFWPGFNPYGSVAGAQPPNLAVVNLPYLQAMSALEPYQVWMQLKPGTTSEELYDSLSGMSYTITSVTDAQQAIIAARNDPLLQGTNGTLSLGFLVSLAVCLVGFLIYWVFAIRERTLQFGLFRAMGLTRSGIIRMLAIEQILISGVALAAGFLIGRATSELFAPMLQIGKDAAETVPPFRVVSLLADQLRIAGFVVAMLVLGFVLLAIYLSRIRIHQAVKLGEE